MAGIVGAAVVSEAVKRLTSFVLSQHGERESTEDRAERLEMAVLKIRTVADVSDDWQVTHQSLLQWKTKLKRAAREGDDILHAHKKQILEQKGRNNGDSFAQSIARVAKRCVPFGNDDDNLSSATVQRFEMLAHGADNFFKFVESGGCPKRLTFLPSLNQVLVDGKTIEYSIRLGSRNTLILLLPWLEHQDQDGHGPKGCLLVCYEDDLRWEINTKMALVFNLSDTVDIIGIAMSCIELLPPQFGAASAVMRKLVAEMPTTMAVRDPGESNPSAMSSRRSRSLWKCHQSYCDPSRNSNGYTAIYASRLPEPVLQFTVRCLVLPGNKSSHRNDAARLEFQCHMSPNFIPESCSDKYERVKPQDLGILLPEVTNEFYDETGVAPECERHWWCPEGLTYLAMSPVFSQPLTYSQLYLLENTDGKQMKE